ncbi:MAG: hypothetical protein ABI652_01280 [Acidobacteriota bacterium]
MWNQVGHALNQSASSVITGVVRLLPGTIAFVVSLVLAAVIGWVLARLVRRVLASVDFDRRMLDGGWADYAGTGGASSPTAIVSRAVWWSAVLLGAIGGLAAFDPTLTSQLALRIFGSAMNLMTAIVLLIVGTLLSRFLARGVLIRLVNMNVPQARLLSLAVKWMVLVVTVAMALDHLSIGGRIVELAFAILFGGIVLTLALAIGLHPRDFATWSMATPREDAAEVDEPPVEHL